MTIAEQRKANQEKFIYASDIPTFDVTKPLPPTVLPSLKWQYNFKCSVYGIGLVRPIIRTQTGEIGDQVGDSIKFSSSRFEVGGSDNWPH